MAPRVAVVGHVEWLVLGGLGSWPAAGEIGVLEDVVAVAAGGAAITAVELVRLGCDVRFLTALGDDATAARCRDELSARGVAIEAAQRPSPQTLAVAGLDTRGERTILVAGPNLLPTLDDPLGWAALADMDAVYYYGGDAGTLAAARRAPQLVAAARRLPLLAAAGVPVDVLVGSAVDPAERLADHPLDPPPATVVLTDGARGGTWHGRGGAGRWTAHPLRGPARDGFGAGDAFAAGLVAGLARGEGIAAAIELGAAAGAAAVSRRGPYG